jgi:two-component system, LytTR family, response regulator
MDKIIRAIIVEDEEGAQKTLLGMLSRYCKNVQIIAIVSSVKDALETIEQVAPDLIFLDIQLSSSESGFDVMRRIGNPTFGVIFVTAYPQFAIKAINSVQPWAYLVKPYSIDELMEAVWIAGKKLSEQNNIIKTSNIKSHIWIYDTRKGNCSICISDIVCVSSSQSVVEVIYIENSKIQKLYSYSTLKHFIETLPSHLFFRVHHGHIINIGQINRVEKTKRGALIYTRIGLEIPVAVKKLQEFSVALKTQGIHVK